MSDWIVVVRLNSGELVVMEDEDERVKVWGRYEDAEQALDGHILETQPWEVLEINV